jgi:hypothetical protein
VDHAGKNSSLSKGSDAPAPANPTTVSNAQTTSNLGTAAATQAMNNVNQVGPNGSVTYDQSGSYTDPTTGAVVPKYTQTTQLDPLSQAILTGTKQAGSTLRGPLRTSRRRPTRRDHAAQFQDAILRHAEQVARPDQSAGVRRGLQQRDALSGSAVHGRAAAARGQLSRQGIPVGSEAYNNAMTQFQSSKNQAYGSARDTATAGGSTAATNLFGLAQQGQNQNIAQQQLAQNNPLSLLSQIYGGASA